MNRYALQPIDLALIVVLGMIALCCGSMAMLILFTSFYTEPEYVTLVPVFLGPTAGAIGAALMILYRQRLHIGWIPLLIAAFLWFVGASLLAFTGFAVFDVDEPSELLPNLGYSLGLCLAPGVILAGMGVLLYWSDAIRNRPNRPQKTPDEATIINDLKQDE